MRIMDFHAARPSATVSSQLPQDYVRKSFPVDRLNTRYVSLADVTRNRHGWRSVTVTKIPGEAARRHVQLFRPPRGYVGRLNACKGLRTDCDCARHTFVWNYALNEKGLAVRDRTDSQPADVTNPENVTGACKHVVLVLRYLMRENPPFPHRVTPTREDSTGGRPVALRTLRQARTR